MGLTGLGFGLGGCRSSRPEARWGVQSGEIGETSAVVWCRSDTPATLAVEWSTSSSFSDVRRVVGPTANFDTDLCAKVLLRELPRATKIHYRARFEAGKVGDWETGSLSTPPIDERDVVLAWSGDTNGQGWGIDPARGGMPAYKALLDRAPDLFFHCGDTIYADNPIPPEILCPDGTTWKNIVTEAKSHKAQTLADYRGNQLYPRLSAEVRACSAAVPIASIWDDHEVRDNWFPTQELTDPAYAEKKIDVLAQRGRRAFYEYQPMLRDPSAPMYRSFRWGPLVEIFMVDGRSFRTPNWPHREKESFFGDAQTEWLVKGLAASTAAWKIIVADMPIGLLNPDRQPGPATDAFALTDGPPQYREVEIAKLLSSLKARAVKNVVWLTADIHYAAAHHYAPERAQWKDMDPFWEFVAGPMHSARFGRHPNDDTFGIDVEWASAEMNDAVGSPANGEQYFGIVRIDGKTKELAVTLVDMAGRDLHTTRLAHA